MTEGIALRRRLLGVDPDEVERLLSEREVELGELSRQARLAEERATEAEERWHALERRVIESEQRALSAEHELKKLQSMLSSLGLELARREQEAESLRLEAEELRRQLDAALAQGGDAGAEGEPRPDAATSFLVSEVAPILRAAEESASMVLRQARLAAQQEQAHLEDARSELQAQLRVITSWWNEVHQILDPIQENLSAARKTIEDIGEKVRDALHPLGGLIGTIGQELLKLSQISNPPVSTGPLKDDRATQAKTEGSQPRDRLTVSIEEQPGQRRPEDEQVAAGPRPGRGAWWPQSERSAGDAGR